MPLVLLNDRPAVLGAGLPVSKGILHTWLRNTEPLLLWCAPSGPHLEAVLADVRGAGKTGSGMTPGTPVWVKVRAAPRVTCELVTW